jgi:carotenoid cleavage dioxygenase
MMDLPYQFNMEKFRTEGPPLLRFNRDAPARFGLFDREIPDVKNLNIRWFDAKTCYVFHTANLYEESAEEVVLHACRFEYISMSQNEEMPEDRQANGPFLHEWRFNLATGKTTERRLCSISGEFPVINPLYSGKKHRFVYFGR